MIIRVVFTQSDNQCNHTTFWVLPIVHLISRLDTVDYICPTWKRNVTLCWCAIEPSHWGWIKAYHVLRFFFFFFASSNFQILQPEETSDKLSLSHCSSLLLCSPLQNWRMAQRSWFIRGSADLERLWVCSGVIEHVWHVTKLIWREYEQIVPQTEGLHNWANVFVNYAYKRKCATKNWIPISQLCRNWEKHPIMQFCFPTWNGYTISNASQCILLLFPPPAPLNLTEFPQAPSNYKKLCWTQVMLGVRIFYTATDWNRTSIGPFSLTKLCIFCRCMRLETEPLFLISWINSGLTQCLQVNNICDGALTKAFSAFCFYYDTTTLLNNNT